MNATFTASEKIGDIVARFPQAADIFRKFNIDFCCGGNRPLSAAISERNIDESKVLNQLKAAYDERVAKGAAAGERDWLTAPLSELLDHVVSTHHAFLNRELPQLSESIRTILRVHGANHSELAQLHKLFNALKSDLESHLIKEEETLFPMIREYEATHSPEILRKAVAVMDEIEREHEDAGGILKELRRLTTDYQIPDDVCTTFRNTYSRLEVLESDLFRHIHLENNIVSPRLRSAAGNGRNVLH